jgi:predicted methyltransferase
VTRLDPLVLIPLLIAGLLACASTPSVDADGLRKALDGAGRPEADLARDAGRKPADVVAFLGIAPGMTVVDLIASSGYYTEVLSVAVGPKGRVYAQNPPFVLELRDGANEKAITKRLAGGRLPNVERLDRDLGELGLTPGSIDAALTGLNFHDLYNGRGREAADGFLMAVKAFLAPGGVLGIIDHQGIAGQDNDALHRVQESLVVEAAKAAGFEVEASGEMLHSPSDDHTQNVFAPGVRGKTDRFVLRLRKPEA